MTSPQTDPGEPLAPYPVFLRRGDARPEVDALVAGLGASPGGAGFHKYLYAFAADQTVVMVTSRDVPLAHALRGRAGWVEPMEAS